MKISQLINVLIIFLVAAGVSVWSFATFGGDAVVGNGLVESDAEFLQVSGRDAVHLTSGSNAEIVYDEYAEHALVPLASGGVVFATLAGDMSVSVQTSFARVDSQGSTAYVTYDPEEGEMRVYAIEHPSLVTFLLEGEELNAISVPTGYRITVPASKVSEKIGLLRLTKLSKEFPVYEIEDDELALDAEVVGLLANIRDDYTVSSSDFLVATQSGGDFGPSSEGAAGFFHNFGSFLRETLTIMPYAQDRFADELEDDLLAYVMTNLLYENEASAQEWLNEWETYEHDDAQLEELYADMFAVLPGDELYVLKSVIEDVLYVETDALTSLRSKFKGIESLLDNGDNVQAGQAYADYQEAFNQALRQGAFDDPQWLDDISREYLLLELLLRRHSIFYSVDEVSLLTEVEEKILALAGNDQDLDEERQAFVQSKIRFLENLFQFVVDRKISADDATDLANELVFTAESYLNAISSKTAVMEYFEEQLEDYDLAIAFMNSPEFYSYADFDEGLEAYRIKVADLEDLNDYIQNLRSGQAEDEVAQITLETALSEVGEDLTFNGVQYSEVISLEDTAYRLFEIRGARTAGYAFEANYDRETHILYDVVIEDGTRFSAGLLVENVREVVEQTMAESAADDAADTNGDDETADEVAEEDSLTETVALEQAENAFEEVGLAAGDFDVKVVDLDANLFSFEGTMTANELPVSGTYDLSTGKASEIVWDMNGQMQTLRDLQLADLEASIEIIYNALSAT